MRQEKRRESREDIQEYKREPRGREENRQTKRR